MERNIGKQEKVLREYGMFHKQFLEEQGGKRAKEWLESYRINEVHESSDPESIMCPG